MEYLCGCQARDAVNRLNPFASKIDYSALLKSRGPDVVFVLGGPGSGKGTFSAKIQTQFGYKALSAGDLIRAERARDGSEIKEMIEGCLKDGKLIPGEITVRLIEEEMHRQGWDSRFLVDGFPRSVDNYEIWNNMLGSKVNLQFVFLLDCSETVMEERLINRGKTSGRSDDNIASIRKRFTVFKEETMPALQLLGKTIPIKTVVSDPGIENVWHEVEAIFRGPDVVFVLGGPGSGKGTFSAKIVDEFGYKTLSAGDLIRAERARKDSPLKEMIEDFLKDGQLIPGEVTVILIEEEMRRLGWENKFLVDGFPRSVDNYEIWHNMLGKKVNLKFVFLLDCSEQIMEERLINRGKTSGRSDDNIATIRKRFKVFKEETLPALELLGATVPIKKVSSDPGIENVWGEVQNIFGGQAGENSGCSLQ